MRSPRTRGIAFMILAAVAFATMSALIKLACRSIPPLEVVVFRGVLGGLAVMGIERARTGAIRPGVDRRRLFLRSLFGFGGIATYVWAIAHIDLGVASALNQSSPVFVALLSILILRERPPAVVPVLVVVAFGGAWLIVSPDLRHVDLSALVGLFSAVSAAFAYITVRQLGQTDHPYVIVRWFSLWSAALAMPFVLVTGWRWPDATELAALVGMAAFGLVGQLAATQAYRLERASLVSPYMYVAVLGSLLYGWLLWDEWPGVQAIVGCAVIVGASILIGWASSQAERRAVTAPSPAPRRTRSSPAAGSRRDPPRADR